MDEIVFGVIGLGNMGERHCSIIAATPGARLGAVCDASYELSRRVAAPFAATAHEHYEAMLEDPSLDAIVICLPSGLHARYGIEAARAGKHVVVEKPIDSQSENAERLIRECDARDRVCAVICQNRYSDGLRSLKIAVDSGLMGQPHLARATVKWFRHDTYYTGSHWRGRREGEHGGVLMNQAVHSIDTLQWLFGAPEELAGFTHNSRPGVMETEDSAVAVFRWPGGLLATLEASTSAAPGFDEAYEVHSATATMRVEKGQVTYWHHRDGLPPPAFPLPVESEDSPSQELEPKLQLFSRQYKNIIQAIRGEAPLDSTPEPAVEVVRTIEKIYAAADALRPPAFPAP